MNPEKVEHFIALIDKALECVYERRKKVSAGEIQGDSFFYESLKHFERILHYLKRRTLNNEFEEYLSRPKGHRPGFGMTYGIGKNGDA